jgi:homoserine kinase
VRVDPPADLGLIAVLPSFAVPTKEARKVVPKTVDLKTMIYQMGHAASFVAGMAKGDLELIASSVKDAVVEPARAPLIPHLKEAEKIALKAGAMASFLAGSGPTIGSFYDRRKTDGVEIANAVQSFYENRGIEVLCYVTTWGEGCKVEPQ